MYIPDLSPTTYNNHPVGDVEYRSVGWLGRKVERKGETTPEILDRLNVLKERHQLFDGWLGLHDCEICRSHAEKGEFFVDDGTTRYVLPNMVVHYITEHGYQLPEIVEDAVLRYSTAL